MMRSSAARPSIIRATFVALFLLLSVAALAISTEMVSFGIFGRVGAQAQNPNTPVRGQEPTGDPAKPAENLPKAQPSANGRFVFALGDLPLSSSQRRDRLYSISNGGPAQELGSINDFEPSWSPDGRKVIFVSRRDGATNDDQNRNIYKMNADGTDQERIGFSGPYIGGEAQPSFSFHTNPNLQRVVYVADYSSSGHDTGVYAGDTNGNDTPIRIDAGCFEEEEPEELHRSRVKKQALMSPGIFGFDTPNYSPDNNFIIFGYSNYDNFSTDIYRVNADGTNCIRIYEGEYDSYVPTTAKYSRDGTKIALHHRESSFPYAHKLRIINSTTGALLQELEPTNFQGSPVWSPNLGENKIAYIGGSNDPDEPIANLEIRTIDLSSQFEEQIASTGIPEGIRGFDWTATSAFTPALTLRINQPHPVPAGTSTTGTLTRSTPAPAGGVSIPIQAFNPTGPGQTPIVNLLATSVTIPEGETQVTFQIDAPYRTDFRTVDIFANSPSPNFGQALATVSVTPARPDLETVSISGPASVAPGASFPLSITVNNIGQETSQAWTDRVYFSTDDQYDPGDTLVRTINNSPSLAAGGTRTFSNLATTIPSSVASSAGQFYLILRTNQPETVSEAGRTANNMAVTTIQIDLPDLVPENLVLPPLVQPNVTYPVSWTTRNIGTIASGTASSRLYYSPDAAFGEANDVLIDTVSNAVLAPNSTQVHNTSLNISTVPARPDGTAYFYVRTDYGNTVYEGLPEGPGENNNTISANTPFEYRVADLQVPATGAPAEVETETAFAMQWTSSNTGNKSAGNFRDRVYFSLDDQEGSDIQIGDFLLSGGLAAGSSVERIQNVTIPTSAIPVSGNYWVYVKTDATTAINEGENENNNTRFQPIYVRRLLRPDLTITNVTGPPTVFFDQTIQVQWTVTNSGAGPTNAPQWSDRLYIGTSPTSLSGATSLKTTQSVSALNPGESYTASAIVKIPRGINGSYHFLVRTDSSGALNEENTTNNISSSPVQVNVPPLPDLIVETVQAPDEVFAGQEISINYSVRNIGTDDAGTRRDRIYFSRDTVLSTGQDRLVFTSDTVPSPAAGQSSPYTSRNRIGSSNPPEYQLARIPSDMEGLWYVFVVADYSNTVYEFTGENNNTNYDSVEPGAPINVLVTPPDLVIPDELTAPETAASGTSFPVTFTVRNQGAFNAAASLNHAVYLSNDQTFDASTDTRIGAFRDPNFFGPGVEHPITLSVSLPNCLPNGDYYLFAVADYDNRQFEFDPGFDAEANNASAPHLITLSTFPPDLQVTSIVVPTITTPGEVVGLSWTVSNLGGETTRTWVDRVYLHSLTPGIGAQLLGSFEHVGGLPASGSYTESRSVTLPFYMEGDYYLKVTTDVSNTVAECGAADNNNAAQSSNFSVQNNLPDLVVDTVTVPATAVVGDTFNVQWNGRNANNDMPANSSTWRDNVYLSSNTTLSNNDVYLGTALHDTLVGSGQTYSKQADVTLGNIAAGTYYILVVADASRNIYEGTSNSTHEANNLRASTPITLTSPAVDLIVGSVNVSLPHHSGTFREISWTVTNNGSTQTLGSAWTDYVILSRDSVLDPTDTTLGYRQRNGVLAGGANYLQTGTFLIPAGLTGDYNIFVITDKNNSVVEDNNANNTSSPHAINLTLPPPAELNITNITPPATISLGGPALFGWTVQNTGANAVNGQWRDTVYLSRDQFWDASDILVGVRDFNSQTTSVPAGGGTYTSNFSFQVPPVEEGTYYVVVRTDAQNRIRETDEGNNVTTSVGTTNVTITELQLNTPLNTTLGNGGQMFFKYVTEPAETLLFSLVTDKPARSNEAFTKFDTMVSRADYDFFSTRPGEGNQENVIESTQDGDYYSMVRTDLIPESFAGNFDKTPVKAAANKSPLGIPVEAQNITVEAKILPFSIRKVSPEVSGNAGYATILVEGAKFQPGATMKLVRAGNPDVVPGKQRTVSNKIIGMFDLKGKAAGEYDVVVTNPDNQTTTLEDGFEIVSGGGAAEPRISIDGPGFTRGGRNRYTISISNDGLNDLYMVPVFIVMPSQHNYELDQSNFINDFSEDLPPDSVPSQIPVHFDQDGFRLIPLTTPVLGSKRTVRINIDVILPFGFSDFEINAFALPPLEDWQGLARSAQEEFLNGQLSAMASAEECEGKWNLCMAEALRGVFFTLLAELLPAGCVGEGWKAVLGITDYVIGIVVKGSEANLWDAVSGTGNILLGALGGIAKECFLEQIPWYKAAAGAVAIFKLLMDFYNCYKQYLDCMAPPPVKKPVSFPYSLDPNDKVGPRGYGAESFVPIGQPLEYRINFENVAEATAPAQLVRITDTLPPALDLRTVRLKEIGFKQYRFVMPANQSFYQSRVQLGEDLGNMQADILAGVDLVNNRVFWNIQAIDPNTSEAPLDPFAGILPPNNAEKDGEGYVIFTVEPNPSFPNRTMISNSASIIFDQNEPIITNATENLLDSVVPTSQIAALPTTSAVPEIQLNWSGTDDSDGSGFAGHSILYSEDGGGYLPFVNSPSATSSTFTARWGKSYRFYSTGRDNAGNIELPPVQPDATITVLGGDTEGDVAPRPNGSDGQVDGSDLTQIRRFVAGLDVDYLYNEFQRVDIAPRDVGGNGGLTASDIVQARRYAAGLDTRAEAAGPNQGGSFTSNPIAGRKMSAAGLPRELRVVRLSRIGDKLHAAVEIGAQGDEVAVGFTLNFDPAVLSNPSNIQLGSGAGSAVLTVNSDQADQGRVGITLDKAPTDPIPAGTRQLVTLEFDIAAGAPSSTLISFGNGPVFDEVANGLAEPLQTAFAESTITLLAPTVAGVSISGRVTDHSRGLSNAIVTISGPDGTFFETRTNTFGNFRFKGVPAGQTYVIAVRAKRYTFSPRILSVDSDITGLEISPDPVR